MGVPPRGGRRLRFGPFLFDLGSGELYSGGAPVTLAPLPARALGVLLERRGQLVTREELRRALWGETVVQYEGSLNFCINQLRSVLDDRAEEPRYVETLRGRGYRFIAPVQPATTLQRGRWARALGAAALSICLLFIGLALVRPRLDTDTERLYRFAVERYERYRYEDNESAIALFWHALAEEPSFAPAQAGLANALAQRGTLRGAPGAWARPALRAAEKAVGLDPNLPEAYKALGLARASMGRFRGAVAAYRRAVSMRPSYADAIHNLGHTYHQMGQWDEAVTWQRRRVAMGDNPKSLTSLARTLFDLGMDDEASALLSRLKESARAGPAVLELLATRELRRGELAAAADHARRWTKIEPSSAEAWVTSGLIALARGNDGEASGRFEHALLVSNRSHAYAALRYAEVRWRLGEVEESGRTLERFKRHCLSDVAAGHEGWTRPWTLALIAGLQGETEEALEWLERSVEAGRRDARWDRMEPAFAALRGHRRFEALLRAMGDDVERMALKAAGRRPSPSM